MDQNTDGIWKELLDEFFPDFTALFFPDAYARIDWEKGFQLRDKELQKLGSLDKEGLRVVDKLIEVHITGGSRMLVMVHIESQSHRDPEFEARMFTYYYRTLARYKLPVAGFAVLADADPSWHPSSFEADILGTQVRLNFSMVKLLGFRARWDELSHSKNRFAVFVQALKGFYKKEYPEEEIHRIHRFFQWIVWLPPKLEEEVRLELISTDDENVMTFISNIEQDGINKGRLNTAKESVLEVLKIRFGTVSQPIKEAVERISDSEICMKLHQHAIQVDSLDAFELQLRDIGVGEEQDV